MSILFGPEDLRVELEARNCVQKPRTQAVQESNPSGGKISCSRIEFFQGSQWWFCLICDQWHYLQVLLAHSFQLRMIPVRQATDHDWSEVDSKWCLVSCVLRFFRSISANQISVWVGEPKGILTCPTPLKFEGFPDPHVRSSLVPSVPTLEPLRCPLIKIIAI